MPVRRKILDAINKFRNDNKVPYPLHFHEDGSHEAQKHAEHCARTGQLQHAHKHHFSSNHGFNREIVAHVNPNQSPEARANDAVNVWAHSKDGHREDILQGEWHAAIGEKDGHVVVRLKTR